MERLKLKCPTCWAETYVVVDPDEIGDEDLKLLNVRRQHNQDHDVPEVLRREPVSAIEENNIRKWAKQDQAQTMGTGNVNDDDEESLRFAEEGP